MHQGSCPWEDSVPYNMLLKFQNDARGNHPPGGMIPVSLTGMLSSDCHYKLPVGTYMFCGSLLKGAGGTRERSPFLLQCLSKAPCLLAKNKYLVQLWQQAMKSRLGAEMQYINNQYTIFYNLLNNVQCYIEINLLKIIAKKSEACLRT